MLTLIIRAGSDPEALVETLSPLVAGVVNGLIGRSILVETDGASAEIAKVADEAGAERLTAPDWSAGLAAAQARAGTDRLIVADAGVIAGEGFFPALERFLRNGARSPETIAATRIRRGALGVLGAALGRLDPDQIVVAPRRGDLGPLWGRSYGRRLTLLETTSYRVSR